jgi:hypothetical protein
LLPLLGLLEDVVNQHLAFPRRHFVLRLQHSDAVVLAEKQQLLAFTRR